jgi:ABC-type transport system involved in cytochrome c biogenesis permease subunit
VSTRIKFILLILFTLFFAENLFAKEIGLDALKSLPIQDGGRIKPLDTFARESMSLVYGKETYEGKPAIEVMMTWLLQPQAWQDREFIEIRYNLVKKALKFEDTKKYFSMNQILYNDHLSLVMQELQGKREAKDKLDPYFQALQRLESQMGLFHSITTGEALRLVPPPPLFEQNNSKWLSAKEWNPALEAAFAEVAKAFVSVIAEKNQGQPSEAVENTLKEKVEIFKSLSKSNNPALYPDDTKIAAEIFYHDFEPFQKAWILYLLAALTIICLWIFKSEKLYAVAWVLVLLGVAAHVFGFALRVYLTGRAPVSNMYESVVWVGFGAIIFSLVIEYFYRWRFILFAGTLVSAGCLLLANSAPVILDPNLEPLRAVLNSNFWLTTHVLTITISYAAFFLAFALGDIGLFFYLKGADEHNPKVKAITLGIYRAMQVGVSFLAPGIILGGIWADYSWGRFWGWDPKETWALIVLLGYIAILHGRIAGIIKAYGLVVWSIVTFSLVIMAWYGVNFILGAGLHSYGFGAGGVEYVAVFVAMHFLYVIFVSVLRKSRTKIS